MSLLNLFKPKSSYSKGKRYAVSGTMAYRVQNSKIKNQRSWSSSVPYTASPPSYLSLAGLFDLPPRVKVSRPVLVGIKPVQNPIKKRVRHKSYALPQLYTIPLTERSVANVQSNEAGLICARRHERTEVMHALGHAGKTGQKPKTFDRNSQLKCERIY